MELAESGRAVTGVPHAGASLIRGPKGPGRLRDSREPESASGNEPPWGRRSIIAFDRQSGRVRDESPAPASSLPTVCGLTAIVASAVVGEKPQVTDLDKTAGQNMQQKAPNKLRRRQGHGGGSACAGVVLPAKRHPPLFSAPPGVGWRLLPEGYSAPGTSGLTQACPKASIQGWPGLASFLSSAS